MFHPKYLGAGLTLEHIETVKEWLLCKDKVFLSATIPFQEEATPFPASFSAGRASNPVTWWKALGSSSIGLQIASSTYGGAIVCSGIICSSEASHQLLWAGTKLLCKKLGLQKVAKLVQRAELLV